MNALLYGSLAYIMSILPIYESFQDMQESEAEVYVFIDYLCLLKPFC